MSRRMIATFASAAGRAASASSSSSSSIGGSSVVVESITTTTARTSGARWLISSRHHSSSSSSSSLAPRLRLSEATSSSRLCIRREGSTTSSASSSSSPQPVDDDDDDPCPPWQNPLHHNNPDYVGRVLAEDFLPGEEMPIVPLPPFEVTTNNEDGTSSSSGVVASPHLHDLANEIVRLSLLEVKELVDRVGDHFGIVDDDDDDYGGGGGGGGDGDAVESTVVVEEQTAFDLKLTGFDEKSKIKVIKEIRAVTSLGLKEAKELVEGAPTTVKKAIKKEEAEELKVRLEAAGATVEIV